jgi:glycine/D-amino acid oxidase-like deaminating enzyme
VSAFNRYLGIDVQEISPREVGELFPLARTDDLLAGFYVKDDGRVDPVDVTMALAKGARQAGATILEGVAATGVTTRGGAVTGVTTSHGTIGCEYVVNCAGMWARQLGEASGVVIPNQAAEHYYLITEAVPGISASWPVLEDPGSYGYFREEVGGLMIGLFEPVCAPWRVDGIPPDFSFGSLPPDWERMGPYLEKAMARVPISEKIGIKKFFCGPESFTPDLRPCVGEAPELRGYFVAAGLNSIGILTGGGIGRVMAHWITTGRPDVDVTGMHVDRLQPYQANPEYRRTRTVESLGMVYQCHYPTRSMTTARGAKRSALHDRLAARGAYFRDVSGWEGADWYAPPGRDAGERADLGPAELVRLLGRGAPRRARGRDRDGHVVHVEVPGAGPRRRPVLDWISANKVDGAPGVITYTQWLNAGGTLEADLTVTKLADDRFWVVAPTPRRATSQAWLARHTPGRRALRVTDVTSGYCQLNVQGPRSRELLAAVTSVDLSTPRSRSAPRARSTSASRACCASASRTSASSATSCTSRPSRRCTSTSGWSPPARRSGCATPASRPWRRCASRRPTATTATTSTTPTARSRPASASRSTSASRAASSARTPCWRARPPAR